MMKKVSFLYGIAGLFLGIYALIGFSTIIRLNEMGRLILLVGSCFFFYFGGLLLSKYRKDNKPMKINLWIYFLLYLLLLITLTLFDAEWGRHGIHLNFHFNFLSSTINLIPFKTIRMYIEGFNSLYSTKQILLNLFGNVIALMPMAFFLPFLFKKQNKFRNFIFTIFAIVFFIEFMQFVTSSGNFDIDDFILNILGASIMYGILKIRSINNFIRNIFLLEHNEISKKSYIRIFSTLAIVLLAIVLLVSIRKNIYNKNLDDYMRRYNPKIEIVDETETCEERLDSFYEDDLKVYYFSCMKSDNVYAIINDEEKYLVKEILNTENFEYNIDIYKILERLDYYQISYIKKDKYPKILFNIDIEDKNALINNAFVGNDNVLDVKFDNRNSSFENNQFSINLYLIPKTTGSSNLEVVFRNQNTDELTKYFYRVNVDENLNVTYNLVENK